MRPADTVLPPVEQGTSPTVPPCCLPSLPTLPCCSNAQTRALSHPLPVLRAREVDRWAHSQQYQALVAANLPRDSSSSMGGSLAGSAAAR